MCDRHLDTFLQVADSGSFLKASEKMFISANAITKQINLLEERLEVKLFRRSPQGLVLTDAGQLIYSEAKKLIRQSNAVLRRARELEGPREYVVHIGVSLMNPVNFLLEQWSRAAQQHPNIKLEIVPFEDTVPAFNEVLDHLGERIDVISCPYDTNFWGTATNPSTCGICPCAWPAPRAIPWRAGRGSPSRTCMEKRCGWRIGD